MSISPQNSNDSPPPRGWKIPGALVKNVALDPGLIYTSADVLLFAGVNALGLAACLAATGIAGTLKTLSVLRPGFLTRHPAISAVAFDDRTPLRAGGLALLVVGGAALSGGALLPAAASFCFAVANIRLAESISKRHRPDVPLLPPTKPSAFDVARLLVKRPEIYLNAGFVCAGLMAGGGALFIIPVVATAFGIGMHNAMKEKPEYNGHPKIITAIAAAVFSGIGHANGHGLIAAAHAINAAVLVEMERRVTPGGMKQIVLDIARGAGRLARKALGIRPAVPKPHNEALFDRVQIPANDPAPKKVSGLAPLTDSFAPAADPGPETDKAPAPSVPIDKPPETSCAENRRPGKP